MLVQKTAQGKVPLWNVVTGQRIERWPVTAKGMLASGEYSATPVEPTGRAKDGAVETVDMNPRATSGVVEFTPVITPSMDVVAGASSPLVPAERGEAVLSASIAVTTLPAVETVTLGQTSGVGASAATLPGVDERPRTTPLGTPAVYGEAKGEAVRDQQPVRTTATRSKGK